nr:MAG TPA: hypothetical protein [Caudoviricetes sp.]DAX75143.1 MAG TPA: hypothetical protein [Caudoviricetes sp.]
MLSIYIKIQKKSQPHWSALGYCLYYILNHFYFFFQEDKFLYTQFI